MICNSCGQNNDNGFKFCLKCGSSLVRNDRNIKNDIDDAIIFCDECGNKIVSNIAFCNECGRDLLKTKETISSITHGQVANSQGLDNKNKKKKSLNSVVKNILVILLFIAVGVAAFFVTRKVLDGDINFFGMDSEQSMIVCFDEMQNLEMGIEDDKSI